MTTAATSLLGLALPVTGELSGTWGDTVNNSITSLLDSAIAGTTTLSTDADVTLSTTTLSANQARQAILLCSGARTAQRNITAPAQSKIYTVINATTGGFAVVIRGVGPTTGVTVVAGESAVVAWNGSDFIKVSNTAGAGTFTNLTVTGNTTLGDAVADTITLNGQFVTGTQLKSAQTATNTLNLAAYDVDGTAYTNLVTLTASNTPTLALTSTGVGTINNMSVGATTASTGAFTTLSASSTVSGTGFSTYLASPPAIGGTAAAAGSFTTLAASGTTTLTGNQIISVTDNTNAALRITQLGTGNALLVEDSTNPDSTPFVIDASGFTVVGHTAPIATVSFGGGAITPLLQVQGTGLSSSSSGISNWSGTAASASSFVFSKSNSGTIGTRGAVASATNLGSVNFAGDDGTNFIASASIAAAVDGTPGTNDMPGRLVFSTTADGASSPTERMRIDSAGNVGIGSTSPVAKLEVAGSNNSTWSVTASITGTTMDVTIVGSGTIAVGDLVFGGGIQPYTRVTALGTGTGGTGTYTVSVSQTTGSGTVVGGATYGNTLIRITDTDTGQVVNQPTGGLQFFTSDSNSPAAGVGAYVAAVAEDTTPDTSLIFGTRAESGGGVDANERMRIDSAGNVGIGTGNPNANLEIANAGNAVLRITAGNTSSSNIQLGDTDDGNVGEITYSHSTNSMAFDTNDVEAMRINSAGEVLVGGIINISSAPGTVSIQRADSSAQLNLYRNDTSVIANNLLGEINFLGNDTTSNIPISLAYIEAVASGSHAAGNNPTDLTFGTTADNSETVTERMRIDSSGNVGIGTNAPSQKLEVAGDNTTNFSSTASSISGTTLTIGGTITGTVAVGSAIFAAGMQPYTRITALGTGTGGAGTYTVNISQTFASAAISGSATDSNTVIRITDTDVSQAAGQPTGGLQFFTSDASAPTAGVGAYVAAVAESNIPDTALVFGTRDNGGGGVDANERMRIDSAGNLGLGVTPSAWSTYKAVQLSGVGFFVGGSAGVIGSNVYYDGSTFRYINSSNYATYYNTNNSGGHSWHTAAIGTAGNAITFTQAMTLDASGNLMLGTTTQQGRLHVSQNGVAARFTRTNNTDQFIEINGGDGAGVSTINANFTMALATAGTERARIDSNGNLLVGTTSNAANARLKVVGVVAADFESTQADVRGISVGNNSSNVDNASVNAANGSSAGSGVVAIGSSLGNGNGAQANTACHHLRAITQGVAIYYLHGNGTSSFTSDLRLKKNVEAARNGYLDDLCKLRVVKYNWNTAPEGESRELGLIAQEVEQVFPGLVQDADDEIQGINPKILKASVLPFMLLKAIQEQQALITSLTARLDAANL
jgi:ribosomal protein S11